MVGPSARVCMRTEIGEVVDHEQSPATELVAVAGSAPGQRILEPPDVLDLTDKVPDVGPGSNESGSAAVAQAVRGQLTHDENDVIDPVGVQACAVRMLADGPDGPSSLAAGPDRWFRAGCSPPRPRRSCHGGDESSPNGWPRLRPSADRVVGRR